ncbi:MAG: Ig-like domain-containing protein [Bacteroidota bacterium]
MKKLLAIFICFVVSGMLLANDHFFPSEAIYSKKTAVEICYDHNIVELMNPELVAIQDPVTNVDATVTVHITVKSLTNFVGISHMLVWDPNVLQIDESLPSNNLTNLNTNILPAVSTGQFSAKNDSTLGFSWIQFNPNLPQNLADGDTLYSIVFDIVGAIGNGTLLREFPENERPPELIRPRNQISIPSGNASVGTPYTGVSTLITTNNSSNTPPSVSFTAPFDGQNFITGNTLNVSATASDSDGFVSGVEFFYNGVSQGIDNIAPYQWTVFNLAAGTQTLRVVATDNNGATAEQTITINVSSPNAPPSVSFIFPNNGQIFNAGDNLNVNVSASDSDGSVAGVELFYDNISQGTVSSSPYQWTIFNLAAGTHNLRAEATDDDGAISQTAITITVNAPANVPPTVSFINPNDGQAFTAGTTLNVEASASDSDGNITGVELFYNGISQGVVNSIPYTWTIPNLASGAQSLQAIATDDDGATAQQTISIFVNAANVPPTLSFISPTAGQTFTAGANLSIEASASDSDGNITGVELFYNGISQGVVNSIPYTWTIPNLASGAQSLQAIATDDDGATAQQTISIVVNAPSGLPGPVSDCINTRDFVLADSPIDIGTYQADQTITTTGNVNINPDDDVLFQAGQSISLQVGFIAAPINGSFTARIRPCSLVNNLPLVAFTQPLNADIFDVGSDLIVKATASDPFGAVANVQFIFDGVLQGTDNIAPYQWVVPNLMLGTHTLQVIATDTDGATAQQSITITVDDLNDAPTVSFTEPLDGDNLLTGADLDVKAVANDADGTITMVELFYDGVQQGIDNVAPYQWAIFNLAAGTHTLRVVATDDDGATAEETITITVSAPNTPPTISFVNPVDGDSFMEGDDLLVEASANDPDGSIANVQFIYDGILQGTDNLNPYQWMLSNLTQGTHTLEVIATDDMGATATATAVITVNAVTTPPVVSFVMPLNGDAFTEGSALNVEAAASDSDGSVVGVQLFYDGILQGTDNTSAYQWIIPNLQVGTHTLQVVATDNNNATAQETIMITVDPATLASNEAASTSNHTSEVFFAANNIDPNLQAKALFTSIKNQSYNQEETAQTMMTQPELIAVQNPASPSDAQITVNITANNLTGVVGVSHMLVWDPDVLRIDRTNLPNSLTNLNTNILPSVSTAQFAAVNDSTLGFNWIQFNTNQPQSLGNGEILYSIVFDVVGTIGSGTLLREFPTNERPIELVRPRNIISIPNGASSTPTPYTPVNTLIVTSNLSNNLPTVSFTAPTDGQVFVNGSSAAVNVSASDSDGSIVGVEFFYEGVSQGTDNVAPYQWNLSNLVLGTRTLRAVATDNEGGTFEQSITIQVNNPNVPPAISFITPTSGQTFQEGNTLSVQVNSSDVDGTITQVEFFYDNVSQGTDNLSPYQWSIPNLTAGSHNLRAVATDDDGATSQVAININVNATNQLPTVNITNPSNGQTFTAGTNIIVEASASDADGTITGVEFFYNGVSQGIDNIVPYQWSLTSLSVGVHSIQVIATDNQGGTAQQTININVDAANSSPTLNIINPTNGQSFAAGASLTVQANASDPDGSITGLEFFYDGISQGIDNVAPYQWLLSNLTQGSHTIQIIATDNSGATTQQTVNITVDAANQAPTVNIVAPTNGQVFPVGANVTVQANTNDVDGTVTGVEFFYNGISEGIDNVAPYQRTIFNLAAGTHTIQVVATDDDGATAQQSITITVNVATNVPPVVSFVSPIMGQSFNEGTSLNVQANASDADGSIMKVELYYDNFYQGADASAPHQWVIPSMVAGTHTLRIVATDNDGLTSEQTLSIVVNPVLNIPPTVSIITPSNGQSFTEGASITVQANASDSDGTITNAELFYDGLSIGIDISSPYQWSITGLVAGTHTIQVIARDDDGATGQQTISINVNATQNTPPTLSFINPSNGQNFTAGTNLNVSVTASDSDGSVSSVELFYNGISQGTDNVAPYNWTVNNLSIGTNTLQAIATDNNGATAQRSISITVNTAQNTPPTLSFVNPSNGQNFTSGANLNVSVNASDSDGNVSGVELFYDGISQGIDNTAPYNWSIPNLAVGTRSLQAIATDNSGVTAQQSISINVTATTSENIPPSITFIALTDGQRFTEGSDLTLGVEATDSDGSIRGTQFFYDGVSQGVDTRSPYEWTLTNLTIGTHTMRAVTEDNDRARSEVTINIIVAAAADTDPVVSFVMPTDGQTYPDGSDVPVEVTASDSDGNIQFVELFLDGVLVRRENIAPYEWALPNQNDPILKNMLPGTYILEAIATDNDGNTSSSSISFTILGAAGNMSPMVSIATPANDQNFTEGSNVNVRANATDSDGTIAGVEMFYDGVSQGTDNNAPYRWQLVDLAVGTHSIQVIATDDDGATAQQTVSITVSAGANVVPSVSFVSPINGQSFVENTNLNVDVNASDVDGTVTQVELFYDGISQGSDNTSPYQWVIPNLSLGSHTLQAIATDDDGATTEQTVNISVTASTSGNPIVTFILPTNGQSYSSGADVTVEVDATDDGRIRYIDLYLDGTFVRREGISPYQWGLSTQNDALLANMSTGTYTLEAIATDDEGNTGSSSITFTVEGGNNNLAPSLSFVNPTSGDNLMAGGNLNVEVNATDSDGVVANVELFYDGVSQGDDNTTPYQWIIANLTVGTHSLRAIATDDDGATTEQSISVRVSASQSGDPNVVFVMPTDGQNYAAGSDVMVEVNATDEDGSIRFVDLFLNGQFVRREGISPYEWGLSTQSDALLANMSAGSYTLEAIATDNDGNTSSETINFNVGSGGNNNLAPTLSFFAPTNGDSFVEGERLNVQVNADDSDGTIAGVELFYNGTSRGTDSNAPYRWAINSLASGTQSLQAVATDNEGATTTQSISINVAEDNSGPIQVSFVMPTNGSSYPVGASVEVEATATSTEGSIEYIDLFLNGSLVRREKVAPYEWGFARQSDADLTNMSAGTYTLEAVAIDNVGNEDRQTINFTVGGSSTALLSSGFKGNDFAKNSELEFVFIQPTSDTVIIGEQSFTAIIDVAGNSSSLDSINLYYDGILQDAPTSIPYEWTIPLVSIGAHTLRFEAADTLGTITTAEFSLTAEEEVQNEAPSIVITTPENRTVFEEGDDITVEADASDSDGTITQVAFFYRDVSGDISFIDDTPPYTWRIRDVLPGNNNIRATATDDAGATADETIAVTVNPSDGTPIVSIITPEDGEEFTEGDDLTVQATARDTDGSIRNIRLIFDENTTSVIPGDQGTWNASSDPELANLTLGLHTVQVAAVDDAGNVGDKTYTINVLADNNGGGGDDNQAPNVSFDQPSNGQNFTAGTNLNVQVSASDSDGNVTGVEFFYGGVSQGTDNSAPYQWSVPNLTVGSFSLRAVATDNEGATTSTTINITVEGGTVDDGTPMVTISTPADGAVFPEGTDLTVSASATDADGIRNIRLLLNGSTVRVIKAASGTWDAANDPALANLQVGTYELKVVAIDNQRNRGEAVHTITVRGGNQAPSISFVRPNDGQNFAEGSDVVVEVDASDVDGSIDSVQLLLNGVFYRTEGIPPYTWGASDQTDTEFANMSAGTYDLEAIAFDNEGASSSSMISFTVSSDSIINNAPSLSFDQPTNGQSFTEGTNLNVQVSANDSDGNVVGVELFYDNVSQGTDNSAPYQWSINNLVVGTYNLRAVATDNDSATTSSTISITVEADVVADGIPVVTISTPSDGEVFSVGTDLTVSASATDADGIKNIRLLLNGSTIRVIQGASGTWDAASDPELAGLQVGTYELQVVAVDNQRNRGEKIHTITVVGENQAPSLSFVTPTDGQNFSEGSDVVIEVDASDSDGLIDSVQLFLNGAFYRTESIEPYTWGASDQTDTEFANMSAGTYNLEAIAFDNGGLSSSTSISFTVSSDGGDDNVAPSLSFDQPNDGQVFTEGTNLNVQVSASDSDGNVTGVELFYDNVSQGTDNSAPYQWSINDLAVGTYNLRAVATDDEGATTSTTISITVEADVVDDGTPIVTISMPADGAAFPEGTDLTVSASATDSDGTIRNIRLILNSSTVRVIQGASGTWDATNDSELADLQAGAYELKVVAVDNKGNRGEKIHNITVSGGNQAPSISFVSPSDGQDFVEGSNVVIEVDASDADGSVDSVQLFLNGAFYRTEGIAPYTWGASDQTDVEFANMSVGTYNLEAIAFDNLGENSSATISFTVSADNGANQAPSVSFTTPSDGQTFDEGTAINIRASASDTDGSIVGVELFYDGISVSTDDTSPYEWTIQNPSLGSHTLRVVATDNEGATAEQSISIQVQQGNTGGSQIPVVSISTPADGAIFALGDDLTVMASASDSDGSIRNVRLFFDGNFVRTISGDTGTWSAENDPELASLTEGTHTVRVVAVDNNGNTGETTHTIEASSLFVGFIKPTEGETFTAGSDVEVEVEASDSDGSISKVDLYLNGQFIRTESIAPYEWGRPNQNDPALKNMVAGSYTLEAIATDNQGNTQSATTTFTVVENTLAGKEDEDASDDTDKGTENDRFVKVMNLPPVVTIQTPQDGQTFPTGTDLTVQASATDPDGSVRNVRLYLNDDFIRTIRGSSGTWDASTDPELANLQAGTYEISVAAVDNQGASSETIVNITVVDDGVNTPPSVSFTTPTDGQTFPEGTNLAVDVAASDGDGSIEQVDLYIDDNFVRTERMAPYTWGEGTTHTDSPLRGLRAGTYELRAVATDNEGAVSEATILISVVGDGVNAPPTVGFATPNNGDSFTEGDNLSVSVDASDAEGSVANVELFYNGISQGTDTNAPYNWTITGLAIGTHTLRAVATDNEGASNETSISITVSADSGGNNGGDDQTVGGENGIPITSIVSPRDGDIFPIGHDLTVVAEASDPDGSIRNVRMYLNEDIVSKIDNPPYEWSATDHPELANLQAGNYDIRVGAVDNQGNSSELTITITVGETSGNQAPSVSFASPLNGSTVFVGEDVAVAVNASDSDGSVTGVEFFYDGISQGTDNSAPYEWSITSITEGSHTLRAVATDDEGAIRESNISISAVVEGQNTPPSISFVSPNDGASFTEGDNLSVSVSASDVEGNVTGVELFYKGASQGTDNTSPYNWTINSLTVGTHSLRAVATDDEGATSESIISINVSEGNTGGGDDQTVGGENGIPITSIVSPRDGDVFPIGHDLTVVAEASDPDGSIRNVRMNLNEELISKIDNPPYEWTAADHSELANLQEGSYDIRVGAVDNRGNSSELTITIMVGNNLNARPNVSFASPTDGMTFTTGDNVAVSINASDSDGSIANVEFFYDGASQGTDSSAPYNWNINSISEGSHTLRAVATDNEGATRETSISITALAEGQNLLPSVSFDAPNNNQQFDEGHNLYVRVNASDSDGTIDKVDLYFDGQFVRAEAIAPYEWGEGTTHSDNLLRDLEPGTYSLRAVATDNEGATAEQSINIRVNASNGGGGGNGAIIAIENMTKTPFRKESFPADDIYSFCLVSRPSQTVTDLHNRNRMRIHNTGSSNLVISQINISDVSQYTLPNNEWNNLPLVIAPNSSYDLLIQFVENRGNRGFRGQTIELVSNAGNSPSLTAELRGAFHPRAEGNSEPLVKTIIQTLGFRTDLGDRLNTARYPDPAEVAQGLHGDIVLAEVWERANPNEPVIGFNLAVYKGGSQSNQGSGLNTRFIQTGSRQRVGGFSFNTCVGFHQSILAKNQSCVSYDLIGGKESNTVDQPFRIVMDGYFSEGRGEVDPETGRRRLLAIRLFKVIDHDGVEIPNHYIAINDYVKNGCSEADGALPGDDFANCDWNDNIAYFVNIKPVNPIAIGGMSLAEVEQRYGKVTRQQELRAYPNPVQQSLNVDLSSFMGQEVTLYIQDQVGKVVRLEEFDSDHDTTATLDMNSVSNGFYILNLRAKDAQLSKKIIVSNK